MEVSNASSTHLLLAKGLWGLVDGTEELQEDANDQHRAEFERRRQKAFSSMVMAISTAQLYLVTSYDQCIEKPLRT